MMIGHGDLLERDHDASERGEPLSDDDRPYDADCLLCGSIGTHPHYHRAVEYVLCDACEADPESTPDRCVDEYDRVERNLAVLATMLDGLPEYGGKFVECALVVRS